MSVHSAAPAQPSLTNWTDVPPVLLLCHLTPPSVYTKHNAVHFTGSLLGLSKTRVDGWMQEQNVFHGVQSTFIPYLAY